MKKIIDLVADSGTGKDQKLIEYIRKNYLKGNLMTKVCFLYGHGDEENHIQLTPDEMRKIVFENNDKDTIYYLSSFFFSNDKPAYLKLMEDMCEADIQVFKTDSKKEHITDNQEWINKYCNFITLDDLNK